MNHNLFDKGVIACAKWFRKVSWVALVFMLLISIVDIAGSKLFGKPLLGSYDLISLSALIVAAFAISNAVASACTGLIGCNQFLFMFRSFSAVCDQRLYICSEPSLKP